MTMLTIWFLQSAEPNLNAVWIAIVNAVVTLGVGYIGYLQLRKQGVATGLKADLASGKAEVAADKAEVAAVEAAKSVEITAITAQGHDQKLRKIEKLVNGNLDAEKTENARLRTLLKDNGVDPD